MSRCLPRDGQRGILSIKDDGIGIAPENLAKIWQRFYQENAARTETAGDENRGLGLGLGLSMVKEIADLLDLKISVSSEADQGSEFILTFSIL